MADEGRLHHIAYGGGAIKQGITEEMQAPGHFVFDSRLFNANFTGHPQKINFVAQLKQQSVAFALGPARVIKLEQLQKDAAVNFQNRNALGFSRVRGERWADIENAQHMLNSLSGNPRLCRFSQSLAERATHFIRPRLFFEHAAISDRGVFFSNIHQLQPNANGLQGMFHQM